MRDFLSKHRVIFSCGFFLLLSFSLTVVNTRAPYRVDPVGVILLEILHPIQLAVTAVHRETTRVWDGYIALWKLRQQNEELRRRIEAMEKIAQRAVELDLANQRLGKLLALQQELGGVGVAARVVGHSPVTWVRTVVLDKGGRHSIFKGMAVLTPEGVVGQVVSLSPHAAQVLLISDPNSGADVLIQRSRVRGIIAGTLNGHCLLKYIQRGDDVKVGDVVITSGLDGIFPKGQMIGTVVRVETTDSRMFQDVEVKLSAELDKVEEVLVVASDTRRGGE
ncbi:MAG: rod shape-determining protein MreC [Candidatus Binatia bacterium]